jgi:hypothetical protein
LIIHFEGQDLKFEPENITVQQMKVIKAHTGLNMMKFMEVVAEGDPEALEAMYWVVLNRSGIQTPIQSVPDFAPMAFFTAINEASEAEAATGPLESQATPVVADHSTNELTPTSGI